MPLLPFPPPLLRRRLSRELRWAPRSCARHHQECRARTARTTPSARVEKGAGRSNVVGVPARRELVGRPMGVMLTPRRAPGRLDRAGAFGLPARSVRRGVASRFRAVARPTTLSRATRTGAFPPRLGPDVRELTDADTQAGVVRKSLQFVLPRARSVAIASPRVRRDEQLLGGGIRAPAHHLP